MATQAGVCNEFIHGWKGQTCSSRTGQNEWFTQNLNYYEVSVGPPVHPVHKVRKFVLLGGKYGSRRNGIR